MQILFSDSGVPVNYNLEPNKSNSNGGSWNREVNGMQLLQLLGGFN